MTKSKTLTTNAEKRELIKDLYRRTAMIYSINLIPAYGRDYKNAADVLKDWVGGKDFCIADIGSPWDGSYTSCRDWRGKAVRIRYNRFADFVIINEGKEIK